MTKKRSIRHNALYSIFGCLLPFFDAVSALPTPTTTKSTTTSLTTSTETTTTTTTSQETSTKTIPETTETTMSSTPLTNSTVATSSATLLTTSNTAVPTSANDTTYGTTTGPHHCRLYTLGRFGRYYVCFKDGTIHRKVFNTSEDCLRGCNKTATVTSPSPVPETTTYTTASSLTTTQQYSTVTTSVTPTSNGTTISASTEEPKRTTTADEFHVIGSVRSYQGKGLCVPVKLRYGKTKLKGFACNHYGIAIVSESEEICETNCLVVKIVQSMSTPRVTTTARTTTSPTTKATTRRRPVTKPRPHKPKRGKCCPKEIIKICLLGNNKKTCRKLFKKCACFA